jgi:RNA polymerase sigma-70 factor, ECF subfamily
VQLTRFHYQTLPIQQPTVEQGAAPLDFAARLRQTTLVSTARASVMSSSLQHLGSGGEQPSSTATSRSLLERVKADEEGAWERLVTLYAPLVFHWCRRWDLREPDIADILQDVFQAVVVHVADFRKEREGDSFRGWLRRITRNKVVDHLRRLDREPPGVGGSEAQARLAQLPFPQPPEEDSNADQPAEADLFLRALELIRQDFEERTWQAFWRITVDGQSPAEVAEGLSMSVGAVRVAKCRVLHRLRAELGDVTPEDDS